MTKKEFEFIRNAVPNKHTDDSVTVDGEDPWVAGAKLAEKQLKEYF